MKRYVLLLLILVVTNLSAQIKVSVQVPDAVAVGDRFRIEYTVNATDVEKVTTPVFSGFELLYGPSTSTMHSYQIINGKQSSANRTTFTYTLMAQKAGNYTIPGATIVVEGKAYKARATKLRVVASGGSAQQQGQRSSNQQLSAPLSKGGRISAKDLFITVTANKTKVYEQEAILLTYKVYTRINLTQLSGKMPDLKGFLVQEVELPTQKNFSVENYHGEIYRSCVWSQYVLFPQQAGKLKVPSIVFDGVVVIQDASIDPFDAFFNGGSGGFEKKKSINSPSLAIEVKPLPTSNRPANFSQAVGQFTISSKIISAQPKTGDAMTLRVTLSGKGNMKLLKTPEVKFPSDFETYAPKTHDQTKLTTAGVTGSMTFDYLVVPRKEGKTTIPSIAYSYFDTETHTYKRIVTNPIELNIVKGKGSTYKGAGSSSIDILNQDIRYIKLGKENLKDSSDTLWDSAFYWTIYAVMLVAFSVVSIMLRTHIRQNADVIRIRGKGAMKLASKRMKKAAILLHEAKQSDFYDEVMRALIGYIGDRFQIPIAELSKDNMFATLTSKGIREELAETFLKALTDCEFARFAPGDPTDTMDSILLQATNAINEMEQVIRKQKK
ncbi:MAG: BatD family protein [Bacteroidaceae bacterium]